MAVSSTASGERSGFASHFNFLWLSRNKIFLRAFKYSNSFFSLFPFKYSTVPEGSGKTSTIFIFSSFPRTVFHVIILGEYSSFLAGLAKNRLGFSLVLYLYSPVYCLRKETDSAKLCKQIDDYHRVYFCTMEYINNHIVWVNMILLV